MTEKLYVPQEGLSFMVLVSYCGYVKCLVYSLRLHILKLTKTSFAVKCSGLHYQQNIVARLTWEDECTSCWESWTHALPRRDAAPG
jgi:hypothetical protein